MNLLLAQLMDMPSIDSTLCPFCGKPAQNKHHIVKRSQGGGKGPTITVCGLGNTSGCHGLLHRNMIHLRWRCGWEWLKTDKPVKYETALEMEGWQKVRTYEW